MATHFGADVSSVTGGAAQLKRDEYKLLLLVGGLGGVFGVGAGVYLQDRLLVLVGIGAWAALLVASIVVIALMRAGSQHARFERLLDDIALDAYQSGGDGREYGGRWTARWTLSEGKNAKAAPEEETIDIEIEGPRLVAKSFDRETKERYWLDGRVSKANVVCLLYWSQAKAAVSGKSGVVLLTRDASAEGDYGSRLKGRWIGCAPNGDPIGGEIELVREGA